MRNLLFATTVVAALGAWAGTGCAVSDGQSSVGQYADDTAITARVKAKLADDRQVSASRIQVETLNGTVQLSGFAVSQAEKDRAGELARSVSDVRAVTNNIIVRPS